MAAQIPRHIFSWETPIRTALLLIPAAALLVVRAESRTKPGVYWPEGGGLRLEDNFLIAAGGAEKLSSFPDGVLEI